MCYVLMYLPQYIPNLSSTFSISYTQEETKGLYYSNFIYRH